MQRRAVLERFRENPWPYAARRRCLGNLSSRCSTPCPPISARTWLKTLPSPLWAGAARGKLIAQRPDLRHPHQGAEIGRASNLDRRRDRGLRSTAPDWGPRRNSRLRARAFTLHSGNGDVVRVGRPGDFRDGVLTPAPGAKRPGATTRIPMHSELAEDYRRDAQHGTPHATGDHGRQGRKARRTTSPSKSGAWVRCRCGCRRHCVFHGLRKAALTRLADAGCTAPTRSPRSADIGR